VWGCDSICSGSKQRREVVEARNPSRRADLRYRKRLEGHGNQLGDADRRAIEEAIAALRTAMASNDAAQIRQGIEALARAAMRIGEAVSAGAKLVANCGTSAEVDSS
jgi:molecular chaperone DnaK